jgi:hypothetical protein
MQGEYLWWTGRSYLPWSKFLRFYENEAYLSMGTDLTTSFGRGIVFECLGDSLVDHF